MQHVWPMADPWEHVWQWLEGDTFGHLNKTILISYYLFIFKFLIYVYVCVYVCVGEYVHARKVAC